MNDEKDQGMAPEQQGAEPAADPKAATDKSGAEPHLSASTAIEREILALKADVAEMKDRLLRAHAEMENLRKRTEREKSEAHKYAVTKFARDIVTVADNFQRAINTVPPGAAEQDEALKSFLEGVTLTERELINVLERNAVKRIDPMGEPFNPHQHQAVMESQNADVPAGTVVQVFQSGYMIEDRVLRPAMVVVAKGGAKVAKPTESGTDPAGNGATDEEIPGSTGGSSA
jgi:molecular chaperone GrpE